jgi:hypothetical protein
MYGKQRSGIVAVSVQGFIFKPPGGLNRVVGSFSYGAGRPDKFIPGIYDMWLWDAKNQQG